MNENSQANCTLWLNKEQSAVSIIDQRFLPHKLVVETVDTVQAMCSAISNMLVRGAGLIGVSAAFGMWLAAKEFAHLPLNEFEQRMNWASQELIKTRPTAVNLSWAVNKVINIMQQGNTVANKLALALSCAEKIRQSDIEACAAIGRYGLFIIEEIYAKNSQRPVNILTHCNAGWLAFIEHGSALSPIYAAHAAGIPVHVWVDETRPRNQGAALTAWELARAGIAHTIIADNAGGHLMQHNMVDMVITGADRVSRRGDVANKIGTYLKALAAHAHNIPMYVALPSSTFDWNILNGLQEICIEEREGDELRYIEGINSENNLEKILIYPAKSKASNWAFDVTPNKYITALICERGICQATELSILSLFPEIV